MTKKLFTHNDLDGYSPYILLGVSRNLNGDNFDIDASFCNNKNIDDEINNFLDTVDLNEYDEIIITDICPSVEVMKRLNDLDIKVILFDHHRTALWAGEQYDWAHVHIEKYDRQTSATEIFFDYLLTNGFINIEHPQFNLINKFTNFVMRYDTWQWKDNINNGIEVDLNTILLEAPNKLAFADDMIHKLCETDSMFNEEDISLIRFSNNAKNKYLEAMKDKFIVTSFMNHKIALYFEAGYTSELLNLVCTEHPEIDFAMNIIVHDARAELRCTRDNIDLSLIAKTLTDGKGHGGGHAKAAGFPIYDGLKELLAMTTCESIRQIAIICESGQSSTFELTSTLHVKLDDETE